MRPRSIVQFDRFFLIYMAASLLGSFLSYSSVQNQLASDPATAALGMGVGFYIISMAIGFGISFLLWWLISRRASNVAKWILTVLTAIGVLMVPMTVIGPGVDAAIVSTTFVTTALSVVAVYFLFRRDAREWLISKGKAGPVDPDVFS